MIILSPWWEMPKDTPRQRYKFHRWLPFLSIPNFVQKLLKVNIQTSGRITQGSLMDPSTQSRGQDISQLLWGHCAGTSATMRTCHFQKKMATQRKQYWQIWNRQELSYQSDSIKLQDLGGWSQQVSGISRPVHQMLCPDSCPPHRVTTRNPEFQCKIKVYSKAQYESDKELIQHTQCMEGRKSCLPEIKGCFIDCFVGPLVLT